MYSMLTVLFLSIVYNADCSPLCLYKKLLSTDCQGGGQPLTGVYPPPNIHTSIQIKQMFLSTNLALYWFLKGEQTDLPSSLLTVYGQPWNYHSTCHGERSEFSCYDEGLMS